MSKVHCCIIPFHTHTHSCGHAPRIGQCAGLEWLPRFMPRWLQDRVLSKALGINALIPQMKKNAAVLAARSRADAGAAGGGGGGEGAVKKGL